MSSGPGILQTEILNNLREKDSYVFQRLVLWEIASERGEIKTNGFLCQGIERGFIKKSFRENFRRAAKRLEETGQIEIRNQKITDLDEALKYFPHHTSDLEIHQLRKKLIPTIMEFVKEEKPQKSWHFDIEENQLSKLKRMQKFRDSKQLWKKIQKNILLVLNSGETDAFDEWLECLVRGRHLFLGKKFTHSRFLMTFYTRLDGQDEKTSLEQETLTLLKNLIDSTFNKDDWKIRDLKMVYYGVADFQQGYSERLKRVVKHFLREKHRDLIFSLPGHEEPSPPKKPMSPMLKGIYQDRYMKDIKYSEYLDKILTRQILKAQRQIRVV